MALSVAISVQHNFCAFLLQFRFLFKMTKRSYGRKLVTANFSRPPFGFCEVRAPSGLVHRFFPLVMSTFPLSFTVLLLLLVQTLKAYRKVGLPFFARISSATCRKVGLEDALQSVILMPACKKGKD